MREAECYIELDDLTKAIALLTKALDLISIDNEELWIIARTHLYNIVGVD